MRFYIFCLFFLLSANGGKSQPGFSEIYDFNTEAYFYNVLLDTDTLIIGGAAFDEATDKVGVLFVKMDTLGHIQNYSHYMDSLGSHLVFNKGYPLLKTASGDYLMAGDVLNRESDFLLTWDANGNVKSFWEYPYSSNILTSLPHRLIEISDGFLLFSTRQLDNFKNNIFVTKVDLNGNIIWEQFYGDLNDNESVGSVWVDNDNTFVIGSSKGSNTMPLPNSITCAKSWIFAIDSLGEMQWEWIGEPCDGDNVKGLQRTSEGEWIYVNRQLQVFDQWNWGAAPKFVKRDNNFNLLWERQVAESYWDANIMIDLHPTPSGDWIGAGTWILPEPFYAWTSGHAYIPGCMYKISNEGDSIWTRCDTVALNNPTNYHEYGGIVVLSSGSVIGVGGFEEHEFNAPSKGWAWVVKVDENGCLEELCTLTATNDLEKEVESDYIIYPNPVKSEISINFSKLLSKRRRWVLYNQLGQVVDSQTLFSGQKKYNFKLPKLTKGIYFYSIFQEAELLDSGQLFIED